MFKDLRLSESLPQSVVDIHEKERKNLFSWRGQFSPQLIESLLLNYGQQESIVYDPFLGSGTVLSEASALGLSAFGCEINPAALAFSRVYELSNIAPSELKNSISNVELTLSQYISGNRQIDLLHPELLSFLRSTRDPNLHIIVPALITSLDFELKQVTVKRLRETWAKLSTVVLSLRHNHKLIKAIHADARRSDLPSNSVDLVITSPPYINVFNYHQNYRKSVESMGVDVLKVAKSEIGANRKFRQNRFLTVVQYCIDMAQVFLDIHRVCLASGKVIFIVGRESKVRHTSFRNAEIILSIARKCGFVLEGQQHRLFRNKFGLDIYEEILRFSLDTPDNENIIEEARNVARKFLHKALLNAELEKQKEIKEAIEKSSKVEPSPILET